MSVKIANDLDFQNASTGKNIPTPVSGGDIASKSYVDSAVTGATGALSVQGTIDCSANPNYPAATKGYLYVVSVAGKIGGASGINVNVGDTIFAIADTAGGNQATAGADFNIVESNRDTATISTLGVVRLATQTEVNNGTEVSAVVTPATLQTKINNSLSATIYSTLIGNNTNSNFTITHGLNRAHPPVTVTEVSTGIRVITTITDVDSNNVTITFKNPPTTNQYAVEIG
jgi:hypothetical protein